MSGEGTGGPGGGEGGGEVVRRGENKKGGGGGIENCGFCTEKKEEGRGSPVPEGARNGPGINLPLGPTDFCILTPHHSENNAKYIYKTKLSGDCGNMHVNNFSL